MRRQIQAVPSDLPHARLYLDDIETFTKILNDEVFEATREQLAMEPSSPERHATTRRIEVLYRIDQEELDSIDDLLSQGGSVKNFEVRVFETDREWSRCSLTLYRHSSPELRLPVGSEAGNIWQVHAKVREVFEKRGMLVKNFIDLIPSSIKYGVLSFMLLLPTLNFLFSGTALKVFFVVQGSICLIFVCCMVALARPSCVYLMRSHERSRSTSETRRKYVIGAITFALGVLFTKLLDHLLARFLK